MRWVWVPTNTFDSQDPRVKNLPKGLPSGRTGPRTKKTPKQNKNNNNNNNKTQKNKTKTTIITKE